jgi:predicted HTH domain antitoxin
MSQATITKSIRLSPSEATEVANLSKERTLSEAVLMKKWILEGIRAEKMEMAIQAYMQRKTDLRGGATLAGVSYNRFMDEVQKRNIIILEDDHFLDSLEFLANAFDSSDLREAVRKVRKEVNA